MSIPAPFANHSARVEFVRMERHVTSMCMSINDWTCADCPGDFCQHECHTELIGDEVPC